MSDLTTTIGDARHELDQFLSDRLDEFNAAATLGMGDQRELTVEVRDDSGATVAGMSGWTWAEAAGIGLTWVSESRRGTGVGAQLLADFEREARRRGVRRVFVTSFTFQAPAFYERHGYREIFRWEGIPVAGHDDVHLRKDLA